MTIGDLRLKIAVALACLALAPAPAFGQDTGTRIPVAHRQTLSTSPVADILGFINGEYQRKITESSTIGVSAGTLEIDDDRYTNGMLFGRYFPQGAALTGFFIGGRVGVHRISYDTFSYQPGDPFPIERRESDTRAAIGIDVGYEWLLGAKRNVLIGIGAGGMRVIGDDGDDNILVAFPTARLNVGFAF